MSMITKGKVIEANLDKPERIDGKSTGRYTITISLSSEDAEKLEEVNVKTQSIKDVNTKKEIKIRKFSTQYKLQDNMIQTDSGEVFGTDFDACPNVQILWKSGRNHSVNGVDTHFTAIKVEG